MTLAQAALSLILAAPVEGPEVHEIFVSPATAPPGPRGVPALASSSASLVAARGERESFFVVVRPGDGPVEHIELVPEPLRGRGGEIPSSAHRAHRAAFVNVGGRQVPDALLPLDLAPQVAPGAVAAENVAVLVELAVPHGTKPGTYQGSVGIRVDDIAARVPVRLEVLEAELPAQASLRTVFDFSPGDAHLGSAQAIDGAARSALTRAYRLAALRHRVTLVGGLPEASHRSVAGEGDLERDFAAFDREAASLLDGVDELGGARVSAVAMPMPRGLSGLERFKYALAFRRHLRARGWADRLVDVTDRPRSFTSADLGRPVAAVPYERAHGAFWAVPPSLLAAGAEPASVRAVGWLAFRVGAEGIRYEDAIAGFRRAGTGAAHAPSALFYPPPLRAGSLVVESLRLGFLGDGLEDYELLRWARANGRARQVEAWLERIVPGRASVTADVALFDAAKRQLGGEAKRR